VKVRDAVTVADVERIARRRIPRVIYDPLAGGGAGDEGRCGQPYCCSSALSFRPRALGHVALPDLTTAVPGRPGVHAVLLAPTGAGRVVKQ